jgi:hypothetical protein
MKVRDILEYGMADEPVYGTSKAALRTQTTDMANQFKRQTNQAQNASDEANIKAAHDYHSQKRKRVVPTGIPARMLAPQTPGSPAQ